MTQLLLPTLFLLPLLAACGESKPAPAVPGGTAPGQPMAHRGDQRPLGEVSIGGHMFRIVQDGPVVEGKEVFFFLESATADQPLPTARAWIGVQSGEGSKKAPLSKEGSGTLRCRVEVPANRPAGAMLWLEVEDGGARLLNSFEWHR